MSTIKSTPGPFTDDPGPNLSTTSGEVDANARLMAAAPELLEACKGLVRYAEAVRHSAGMGKEQLKRLESAKAAIARATGAA